MANLTLTKRMSRKTSQNLAITLTSWIIVSCSPQHTILDVTVGDACPFSVGQGFTVTTLDQTRALLGEKRGGANVKKDEFETTQAYEERKHQLANSKSSSLAKPLVFLIRDNYPLTYDADDQSFEIYRFGNGSVYGRHESLGTKKSHLAFYAMNPPRLYGLGHRNSNRSDDDDFLVYDKVRLIKDLPLFADRESWDRMIAPQAHSDDLGGFDIKLHVSAEEARAIKSSLKYYAAVTPRPPYTDSALRTDKNKPTILFADIHCAFFSKDGKTVAKIFGALEEPDQ